MSKKEKEELKQGQFLFHLPLETGEGAYVIRSEHNQKTGKEDQFLLLKGWATDSRVDKLKGHVEPNAVVHMVNTVNDLAGVRGPAPVFENTGVARSATPVERGPVGVDIDHSNLWNHQIGRVTAARIVPDEEITETQRASGVVSPVMEVELAVDLGYSAGRDLQTALDRGKKMGLSIFGELKRGRREVRRSQTGVEVIKHFEEIDLHKIAITTQPVNTSTWVEAVARSMSAATDEETMEDQEIVEQEAALETSGEPSEAPNTEAESSEGTTAPQRVSADPSDAAAPVPGEAPAAVPAAVLADILESAQPAQTDAEQPEVVVRSEEAAAIEDDGPLFVSDELPAAKPAADFTADYPVMRSATQPAPQAPVAEAAPAQEDVVETPAPVAEAPSTIQTLTEAVTTALEQVASTETVALSEAAHEDAGSVTVTETPIEGEWISRAVYESQMSSLMELLTPLSGFVQMSGEFISRAEERIGALETIVGDQNAIIQQQNAILNKVQEELEAPQGRRGFSIAEMTTSMLARSAEDAQNQKAEAERQRREAIAEALAQGNMRKVDELVYGRFQNMPPSNFKLDPLNLLGRYQERQNAAAAAQQKGSEEAQATAPATEAK